MAMIDKLFYRTQPVLPAVYDDALSYYEVLAKVVHKLNETIDVVNQIDTQTIIDFIESGGADEALQERIDALAEDLGEQVEANTEALKDTLLKYDHFYKATDLEGVTNDGLTDCYVGLRQFFDGLWTRGESAIVYFPSGVYLNSIGTLPIPANTIIFGDGESSVIYRNNVASASSDTGVLCPCGDNIIIYNLKVKLNVEDVPLSSGSLAVGVGITNIQYPGLYPEFNVVRVALRRNITCDHVYSDGVYPLQAEVARGTGCLENITFKNGNYPNGIVSMYPWWSDQGATAPGSVGGLIENIRCKWLRVGARVGEAPNYCMYAAGLRVNNCRAELAWFMADGVLVNGLLVDARSGLTLNGQAVAYAVDVCGKVNITNADIVGGGANRTYGVLNRSLDSVMFTAVRIRGFTSGYLAQTIGENQTPGLAMLANCDFGEPNCGVIGYGVNCLVNVPTVYKYLDFTKARYATLTAGTGVTFDVPNRSRVYAFGTMASMNFIVSGSATWSPSVVISTMPEAFRPVETNTLGVFNGVDQDGNAVVKAVAILPTGEIKPWGTDSNLTAWSGSLTAMYSLV